MNRVLIIFCLIFVLNLAYARSDMNIEGSCKGVDNGNEISFIYYSSFDGCHSTSQASLTYTSQNSRKMKGTRVISNDLDTYTFSVKEAGQLKTVWLDFPDTTGIKQGLFKFRDINGVLKSVLLDCKTYDYEYSECLNQDGDL